MIRNQRPSKDTPRPIHVQASKILDRSRENNQETRGRESFGRIVLTFSCGTGHASLMAESRAHTEIVHNFFKFRYGAD